MANVIITDPADADTAMISEGLTRNAGARVAEAYNAKFEHLYDQLADHPGSCQARPNLDAHIRVGVVNPYLVIYPKATPRNKRCTCQPHPKERAAERSSKEGARREGWMHDTDLLPSFETHRFAMLLTRNFYQNTSRPLLPVSFARVGAAGG
jgi:toxin ParE1/3/4